MDKPIRVRLGHWRDSEFSFLTILSTESLEDIIKNAHDLLTQTTFADHQYYASYKLVDEIKTEFTRADQFRENDNVFLVAVISSTKKPRLENLGLQENDILVCQNRAWARVTSTELTLGNCTYSSAELVGADIHYYDHASKTRVQLTKLTNGNYSITVRINADDKIWQVQWRAIYSRKPV